MESGEGLWEIERHGPAGSAPRLLIELPHGATRAAEFEAVRARLEGPLPDRLEEFFFVNTDVGTPEVARAIARSLVERAGSVVILRCLVPRTFADTNRVLDAPDADYRTTGITPAVPDYIVTGRDRALLRSLHERYLEAASTVYREICGAGAFALQLHTYAPKSIRIESFGGDIVDQLRAAYEPGTYAAWPDRPQVEAITEATDGTPLAPRAFTDALRAALERRGLALAENVSYRLHPSTLGHVRAVEWPGRVACIEINRARLADPFTPFEEMRISSAAAERDAAPLVEALEAVFAGPGA